MIDSFKGVVWRHVPTGAHPLHAGWILRASGRWNRPGRYGCLYTAMSRAGAVAEWQRYVERAGPGAHRRPRDVVSIAVRVGPVADLTDHTFRRRFGVALTRLTGDDDSDWEAYRTVADVLRAERYRALTFHRRRLLAQQSSSSTSRELLAICCWMKTAIASA